MRQFALPDLDAGANCLGPWRIGADEIQIASMLVLDGLWNVGEVSTRTVANGFNVETRDRYVFKFKAWDSGEPLS